MRRLASLVDRHPVVIVLLFLSACLSAVWIHGRLGRYDMSYRTMAPKETPQFAVFEEFLDIFGDSDDTFIVAFRDDPLLTNENLAMIGRITDRIDRLEATESVSSLTNVQDIRGTADALDVSEFLDGLPQSEEGLSELRRRLIDDPLVCDNLISHDGLTAALVGRLTGSSNHPEDRFVYFDAVEQILAEEGGQGVEFHIAGNAYMNRALTRYMIDDTTFFIPVTIAVQCALLWLAFGRMRAVWMPITPVAIAAVLTMGSLTAFGIPMSLLTGQGVLSSLIIVIGLSNAVHLLSRYDEEIARDPDAKRAAVLAKTMEHVGSACLLTSMTTAIGFISLGLADIPGIRDFGRFGALGIGFALATAVVLLPALIILVERMRRSRVRPGGAAPWLARPLTVVARVVLRYPRPTIAIGVLSLVLSAVAVSGARIDGRQTADLKSDDPAVLALKFLERNLGGTYQLEILVRGNGPDSIKDPDLLAGMEVVRSGLEELPMISKVVSPVQFIKKMNRAMNENDEAAYRLPETSNAVAQYLLLFEMAGSDAEFERLVNYDYSVARMTARLKDISPEEYQVIIARLHELADGRFDTDVQVYESGELPLWHTVTERLISTLLRSLYFAMPLIFVVIGLTFRSARLGLLSTLPNILPLTVGLGLMGIADIPLRLSTITAFPLAFGLAIDDTIHFIARYRSELARGQSPEQAVTTTIETTGRAIVLTTIFLVGGYAVLFASNFLGIIHVAVLVCVILVAALFGDLFVLPALLITFRPALLGSEQPERNRPSAAVVSFAKTHSFLPAGVRDAAGVRKAAGHPDNEGPTPPANR